MKQKNVTIIAIFILAIIMLIILSMSAFLNNKELLQNGKNVGGKTNIEDGNLIKLSHKIKARTGMYNYSIVITIDSDDGIEYVEKPDGTRVNAYGRKKVNFDYDTKLDVSYDFKIKTKSEEETTETIFIENTFKAKTEYRLVNGVYSNIPALTELEKYKTRYLTLNDNGNLIPLAYISDTIDYNNWYDYKNKVWPNIYVENGGIDSYYVWIPRYVYKLNSSSQTVDVKFVDIDNNYKDENGIETKWQQLEEQGYILPIAFTWGELVWNNYGERELAGYWISKYQLAEHSSYKLDFDNVSTATTISIKDITTSVDASKFMYYVDGNLVNESTTADDFTMEVLDKGNRVVNVTAINENGEIIASMTKLYEVAIANAPDLRGFNEDVTFYVYWDEEGNKHTDIPISMPPPENWYDYSSKVWANIVTKNNGLESYFVWIPRYQYILDTTTQKAYVKFIEGTDTKTDAGYKIPTAFTWGDGTNNVELTGYWIGKYQLSG